MKKVFSILVVMAFVFAGVAQNDASQPKKNKKVKTPEITFVNLVHDYGQIEQGANGECEFEFKNTGKADLILTNCRSSCGCTVPSWPKDPIAPGKKAVIKVKYNTQRIGQIICQCQVGLVIEAQANANHTFGLGEVHTALGQSL